MEGCEVLEVLTTALCEFCGIRLGKVDRFHERIATRKNAV